MVVQVLDVGVAFQQPEQLVNDAFQMHLFRRDQRKTLRKVKAHLVAEHADGAGAGAVAFLVAVVEDVLE